MEVLSGNEAIAHALLENNVRFASAYPGTPSSEILTTALKIKAKYNLNAYIEWSINEKVALEEALSASFACIDSAFFCKQVGLNVALDPLISAALTGTNAAFLVVVADDPGPYSSQTEQDSRFLAFFAKIPVFDPSDIKEAYNFTKKALDLSRQYQLPVMLRTTTRISHGRQNIYIKEKIEDIELNANFEKNPSRFAATPKLRYILHKKLNEKLSSIALKNTLKFDFSGKDLIISSGLVYSNLYELILEHHLEDKVTLAKADMPYPLPNIDLKSFDRAIAVEETYPLIELQLNTQGRRNNLVPKEGELVITTLTREGLPLIRYRTKDITKIISRNKCDCGRTHLRVSRLKGRTDDMLKVKGVNFYPSQIEQILLQYKTIGPYYQIVLENSKGKDEITIILEKINGFSAELKNRLENALYDLLGFHCILQVVPENTIQRTPGKMVRVIDKRKK